jgi:hypothetical protein
MSQQDIEKVLVKNKDKFLMPLEIVASIKDVNRSNVCSRLREMRKHNMVISIKITKQNVIHSKKLIGREIEDLNLTSKTLNNGLYVYKYKAW